jgi:uroporphyrinogen decarboxylase
MRQAGRSLPEYRALRGEGSILEAVARPEVAAEISLQPVRRYGVDAAILFSDIVVPLAAIGVGIEVSPGRGPVLEHRFGGPRDLPRLRPLEPDVDLPHVAETIAILTGELDIPLIGFAGAPFTLATYLVEGGPSRTFARTKALMRTEPAVWAELLDRLAGIVISSLRSQVQAGVAAVQIFDSWVGELSAADYRRHVLPASAKVFAGLADLEVPRIHFGVGTGELLGLMAEAGADVVGVDWRIPLSEARRRSGGGVALQGNLDPTACLAPREVLEAEVRRVLDDAAGHPGHIFNLGHGVLPETNPDALARVVELVHEEGLRRPDHPAGEGSP